MVRLCNDAAALLSMRESDFDVHSAYGEVIDNAIQANASKIKIKIEYDTDNNKQVISRVLFGDDGDGMPTDILHRCLQMGYSSRYGDRSGIGRFGVGAILGAINQCQEVTVYSKQNGGHWLYTYVDLEPLIEDRDAETEIPLPAQSPLPAGTSSLCGSNHGTLVIWDKYDRQPYAAEKIIEEAHEWIGRTFRYFIWDGVEISLNGKPVKAIDPLFVNKARTAFPDDPVAHEYKPSTLSWPVPPDARKSIGEELAITIRMSFLPLEFRQKRLQGGSNEKIERFIPSNEGISIIRNRREVFYGHIPYWKPKFEEIDRWWGCEIAFDAILDREFTVKNIKRGAVPLKDLKEALAHLINPTRAHAIDGVREAWKKFDEQRDAERQAEAGIKTQHSAAEDAATNAVLPANTIDRGKDKDVEANKVTKEYLEHASEQDKALWAAKFKSQPFSIVESSWKGPHFFETNHIGGASVLLYNTRHPFFDELKAFREELSDSEADPKVKELIAIIDLLLMSYSKTEAMFEPGQKIEVSQLLELMRSNWGQYLTQYLQAYRAEKTEA